MAVSAVAISTNFFVFLANESPHWQLSAIAEPEQRIVPMKYSVEFVGRVQ